MIQRQNLGALFMVAIFASGCGGTVSMDRAVSSEPVPTAMFVFFEPETTELVEGSEEVFERAASVLRVFENVGVKLVGHRAADESAGARGASLDEARLSVLSEQMDRRGVGRKVVSRLAQGTAENMAPAAGGDHAVDRRGELIFGAVPVQRN